MTPTVNVVGDFVDITWNNSTTGRFHRYWLRENCPCPHCTHPSAWERVADFLAIPLDIAPLTVSPTPEGLSLTWPTDSAPCDGTLYSWQWLWDHRTEPDAVASRQWQPQRWTSASVDLDTVTHRYDDVITTPMGLLGFVETVDRYGIAIVDGCPTDGTGVVSLAERFGFVEESHFGRRFDVRSKPSAENLAYTAHKLLPHNDLPSRQHMPGIQLLLCCRNEATGGESVLVDGLAVAERLRQVDPDGFELLVTQPVTYTSIDETWHIINRAPLITTDHNGNVVGTRIHPALIGPIDVPPDLIGAFYRAHRTLLSLTTDPEFQLVFRLEPGQCQVFDNQRILHARQAFDPQSGDRHLEGCYVPLDELRSTMHLGRRAGATFRTR